MRVLALLSATILVSSGCLIAQPASFSPRGAGGGGAMFTPRFNPANDNEFYVACDMSELFHTTDFGNSYTQLDFHKLPVLNTSTYEFTNDPMVAYSTYNDGNEGYPVKTTNGGNIWTMLPGYDANEGMVYRMYANYNNPVQLLMNYYGSIVISNDGGNSFQLVKQANNNGAGIVMGGVFIDGSDIYIGTNDGLLHSSNGGSSFSVMTTSGIQNNQRIWSFAGGTDGLANRFVCIAADEADIYNGLMPWDYYGFSKAVYTMDNASGTWLQSDIGIDFNNDYLMVAAMAHNDINTIYLGGNDNALGAPLVYKSTLGGGNWSKVFNSNNNQNIKTGWSGDGGDKGWGWGETVFGLAVAPNNSDKVIYSDFGFIHATDDGGATWKQAYVNNADQHPVNNSTPKQETYHSIGLENTTSWQVHWQSASNMMAAYSDIGGIRSPDSGITWGFTYTGMSVNSIYRIVGAPLGRMFAATSGIHDIYQSTRLKDAQLDASDPNGKIMYSDDNGASWNQVHAFGHPVFWIAQDPNNAAKMYASVVHYGGGGAGSDGGIWMTSNLNALGGSTWQRIGNPLGTDGHPASIVVLNDGFVVCTFSGRMTTQFTASSGVFLCDPTQGGYFDRSDPAMRYWTKDVVLDPTDPVQKTWYVCVFSGWGGAPNGLGGLYKTIDRGQNWTKLTGSQFDRVTSITFNPDDATQAFLTTEGQGLWMSSDMNAVTPGWTEVTSYNFRQPERVFFNPYDHNEVWVTSFGNGLKVGYMNGSNGISFTNNKKSSLEVFPNPAIDQVSIRSTSNNKEGQQLLITNISGATVYTSTLSSQQQCIVNVKEWPAGIYVIKLGAEATLMTKR
jgi:photosystem II stability/assembly factor-like uncharacterized protein